MDGWMVRGRWSRPGRLETPEVGPSSRQVGQIGQQAAERPSVEPGGGPASDQILRPTGSGEGADQGAVGGRSTRQRGGSGSGFEWVDGGERTNDDRQ